MNLSRATGSERHTIDRLLDASGRRTRSGRTGASGSGTEQDAFGHEFGERCVPV